MEMLNRSAVIVKPRQPYLEWTRRDDTEGLAESVFETLRKEPTIYLLPEYEASWPKNRTLEMFREWFEVQMSSIVEDLYLGEALEYLQ